MAELYFGYAVNTGTAVAGSTPGFSYSVDAGGNGIAWNTDVTAASAPVWADSGQQAGLMVLLTEQAAAVPAAFPPAGLSQRAPSNRTITIPVRIGSR